MSHIWMTNLYLQLCMACHNNLTNDKITHFIYYDVVIEHNVKYNNHVHIILPNIMF